MTALDAAIGYTRRGWSVIPVPTRSKDPGFKGWQKLRLTESDLPHRFNCKPQNIGLQVGEPSGWVWTWTWIISARSSGPTSSFRPRPGLIALMAWGNLQKMMAVIRTSTVFKDQHKLHARGPTMVARCAFLFGRQYALWEAGVVEQVELPDLDQLKAEIRERPDLKEQLKELREVAEPGVLKVAEAVQESIRIGVGVEALSQWEGFGRFCRRCLGVEPLTLLAAYGVGCEDPASEVLAVFPDAKADEAKAEERAGHWAAEWERRFGDVTVATQ